MSDYRFQVVEHNGIPCIHVLIDETVIDANGFEVIPQTYIPIDDIRAAIERYTPPDEPHIVSEIRAALTKYEDKP